MIAPGTTVRAVQNDVALNLMRPAELVTLSDYPQSWAPEQNDLELSLPHGLLLDVIVDAHGQMTDYQILSGPNNPELRRQLDQMLLFSRFRCRLAGWPRDSRFSAVRSADNYRSQRSQDSLTGGGSLAIYSLPSSSAAQNFPK